MIGGLAAELLSALESYRAHVACLAAWADQGETPAALALREAFISRDRVLFEMCAYARHQDDATRARWRAWAELVRVCVGLAELDAWIAELRGVEPVRDTMPTGAS